MPDDFVPVEPIECFIDPLQRPVEDNSFSTGRYPAR
jgi:hypothetical protein